MRVQRLTIKYVRNSIAVYIRKSRARVVVYMLVADNLIELVFIDIR